MFEDTRPAELDATGDTDPWAPFRVGSPGERLRVLRDLRDRAVPVMLHSAGAAAVTATLWALDAAQQCLSFIADGAEPQLARLAESDEVAAVAYCDSVKLQFELHRLVLVRSATASALQCSLPDELYRFQRRNAYRVRPTAQPSPVVQLRHPAQPDLILTLPIIDLSIGGCALWLPAAAPPLRAGALLDEMRCQLDTETRFTAAATVQHVSSPTQDQAGLRGGGVRLGCAWRPLGGPAERVLQRWIDQAQRRRRLFTLE